jgi:hypothetical protein
MQNVPTDRLVELLLARRGPCCFQDLEHRAGIEPAYTGFADLRVNRFATGACETGVGDQGSGTGPQAVEAHDFRLNF